MIVYIKEAICNKAIFEWYTNATETAVPEATLKEHKLITTIQ
jgi:hypothetical protein